MEKNLFSEVVTAGELRLEFGADHQGRPHWGVGDTTVNLGPVELSLAGQGFADHHGSKLTGGQPGRSLVHKSFRVVPSAGGRTVVWDLGWQGLVVTATWQLWDGLSALRSWVTVRNDGADAVVLEHVASLAMGGLTGPGPWEARRARVHLGHNSWYGEAQWKSYPLEDLGLSKVNRFSMKRISLGQQGTWPTSEHLPMGLLAVPGVGTWGWQIEHQGSWHWEISDLADQLYLQLCGPTGSEHGWAHRLSPGEQFQTVPAALVFSTGGTDAAMALLTQYRRKIRRPHPDNQQLPVIFNDYMNCLMGDPTTAKLLPLIDAAAETGCEVFCIDAGWYADGDWFDGVGEWLPSLARFPGGIQEPLERIRARGMVSGLWLEIEVMGVRCPLASTAPEDWFFQRNGHRVVDNGRHFLDFRCAGVRAHADRIIDRLVGDYGVGYIKMDYNNNAGAGTDLRALGPADGLVSHQRAYLAWLEAVLDRYPTLVIENCGSGGLRMEYALLSRHPIQSVSDQTDYRLMAAIAAAAPTAVTPEQAAIWSYPLRTADREETVFNMVNALVLRVHQSGHLSELGPDSLSLVAEGLAAYKTWRHRLVSMVPFWPLGWPSFGASSLCLGLNDDEGALLAVWRTDPTGVDRTPVVLPVQSWAGKSPVAAVVYPRFASPGAVRWDPQGFLEVELPPGFVGRIVQVTWARDPD